MVQIISKLFITENSLGMKDIVTIDGIEYSGERIVNQIVPKNFTIQFTSNNEHTYEGFILNWSCVDLFWSEWNQASDGTCNLERKKIKNKFGPTEYTVEYKKPNESCG